jgi:hypothetical protein
MTNKRNSQKIIRTLGAGLLFVVLCILFGAVLMLGNVFDNDLGVPVNPRSFSHTGSYKINPDTILKSIDNGEPSLVFLPETMMTPGASANREVNWTQAEYYKIAAALFEFVWKESLNKNWSIKQIGFSKKCGENPVGFEGASFVFNQLLFSGGRFRYASRAIEINPLDGEVLWGGDNTYQRSLFEKDQFDLDNFKITADDALRIAEENGGRAARQSVQNECDLQVGLRLKGWDVKYYDYRANATGTLFKITVDPYTGKVIKSR